MQTCNVLLSLRQTVWSAVWVTAARSVNPLDQPTSTASHCPDRMSAAAAVVYMQPVIDFAPVWFKATLHIGMPLLVATGSRMKALHRLILVSLHEVVLE